MKASFLLNRRKELGLSQNDIADKLNYSPQMVSFWESGKNVPSFSIWSQYASLLQIDLEGFLFDKVQKNNDYCELKKFDSVSFSKNLKRLRTLNGLTQSELAKKLGVNNKTVSSWERNSPSLTIDQFKLLVELFNCSIDNLYFSDIQSKATIVDNKNKRTLRVVIPLALVVFISGGAVMTTLLLNNKKSSISAPTYKYDDTNHWLEDVNGNITGSESHSFDSWVSKNKTCVIDGEMTHKCTVCGYTKTTVIEATGHVADDTGWHFNDEYHYHICKVDNVIFDKTLHEYGDGFYALDGKSVIYKCTVCEHSKTEPIDDCIINRETYNFGIYPQSRVTDESLIVTLNGLTEKESNGYYLYNNNYYCKGTVKTCYASNHSYEKFNDGQYYSNGEEYWFNVDPITWKILEKADDYYLLFADSILDVKPYSTGLNNYKDSSIREWLNNEFYSLAFFNNPNKVLISEVDNSLKSTKSDANTYVCENTFDRVFLPSMEELTRLEFDLQYSGELNATLSDYARINEAWIRDGEYKIDYYSRSPAEDASNSVKCVLYNGNIGKLGIYDDLFFGVRPMMKVAR